MKFINIEGYRENCDIFNPISIDSPEEKNYCPQTYFAVNNMFSELITESEKLQARTNLDISWKNLLGEVESSPGLKDFILDQLTWDNINGDATITESLVGDELIIVNQDGENKAVKASTLIKGAKEIIEISIGEDNTFPKIKVKDYINKIPVVTQSNKGIYITKTHTFIEDDSEGLLCKDIFVLEYSDLLTTTYVKITYRPDDIDEDILIELKQDNLYIYPFNPQGNGNCFLSDDGTYKEVNTSVTVDLTNSSITEEKYNEMYEAINNNTPINVLIYNEAGGNFIGLKQADVAKDPGGNIHLYYTVGDGEYLTTKLCETHINGNNYSVVTETTPINNLKPYLWDGTTSETKFNEMLQCLGQHNGFVKFEDILYEVAMVEGGYILLISSLKISMPYICSKLAILITPTEVLYYNLGNEITYISAGMNPSNILTPGGYKNFGVISKNYSFLLDEHLPMVVNELQGEFSFGDTVYTVAFPSEITWITYPSEFKPNTTYQFEITNNIGKLWEVGKGEIAYKSDVPTKVSELEDDLSIVTLNDSTPIVESLVGDELIPIKQDGENKAVSVEQIKNEVINNGIIEFPSKYEFVDLGFPSGTMWATCNIGANSPEGSGLYFAWGETEGYTADDVAAGKKTFTWDDYKFGTQDNLTKYNTTDGLIQLELIDDAAYQRDSTFRVPNYDELAELNNCTTSTWETLNGINGRRFTSNINGNSIFIPAAGYYNSGSLEYGNSQGYYWGNGIVSYSTDYGDYFGFNEEYAYPYSTSRNYGFPIRPVKPSKFAPVDLKNLPKAPYVWDGTTISETIFMELLTAIKSNREIILSTYNSTLSYRLIGSTYMSDTLALTFCESLNAPNFLFTVYYITPNSVEFKTTSFYNKRDSDNTRLNTAFYNNPGLITQDTKFTNKGTLSALEYDGQFHFGDTIYNITFPSGVKWSTDSVLDYKPNHTYQFRIVRGFGVMKEIAEEILTMTIGGTSYNFEKGFTWKDWVNSKYSNNTFYIHDGFVYAMYASIAEGSVGSSSGRVLSSDLIVEGAYDATISGIGGSKDEIE